MFAVLLPPTIALKSPIHDRYLTYTDDSDSSTHGYVRFEGSNMFSPSARFEVVTANTGTGLVHIRCRHNRKFLRRRNSDSEYLSPDAAEPEEDQSKWSCTLFRPGTDYPGTFGVVLQHVQSRLYAEEFNAGAGVRWLKLGFFYEYSFIDLESLVILPKHVAFKADNGKYLKVGATTSLNPTFTSTDKGIAESWFETTTDGHARMEIMSFHTNKYLQYNKSSAGNGDWIMADSVDNSNGIHYWFSPVKVDATTVALKALGENFCSRRTFGGITDGLSLDATTISTLSRLTIEELVLSRRIYDTKFDLANAMIYGETPMAMATASVSNSSSAEDTVQLRFLYTESKSTMWTSTHSWMVGVSVTASFKIPFIGGSDVTATAEYNGSYEWGETHTTETALETTYTATVPPYSSIIVRLLATEGTCDVNYSYYQRDVLYNGQTVIFQKDDGVCTAVNSYNFQYEVTTVRNMEPGADLSGRSVPTTVQLIPLPELSGPTTVKHPVTTREPPRNKNRRPCNHEGGETVA